MAKHTRKKRRKKQIIHNNKREDKGPRTEQELARVERTLGAFLIAWGDIEVSIRALELMLIDEELTFSAKSEEINENWYRPSNAFFRKRLENVLPEKSDLIEKLLQLSNIRNFIVHNSLQSIRPSADDEFMPVIMHGDICASMFAQSECLGITKLYSPKMKFSDGQFITMEKINKATHDLKNIYQILVDITDQIRELGPNKKVRFTTMPIEKLANKKQ